MLWIVHITETNESSYVVDVVDEANAEAEAWRRHHSLCTADRWQSTDVDTRTFLAELE